MNRLTGLPLSTLAVVAVMAGCGGSGDGNTPECTGDICDLTPVEGVTDIGKEAGQEGLVMPELPMDVTDPDPGTDVPCQDGCTGQDVMDEEVEQQGGFKWPCETWEDCLSGICIDTLVGKQCSVSCIEDCPDPTWTCEFISPPGLDALFACVPPKTALCRPCEIDDDCTLEGEAEALCVTYGAHGRFCGVDCTDDEDSCPPGYTCLDVDTDDGTARQCAALSGDCPCLLGFVGLSTECFNQNTSGTCFGKRSCVKPEETPVWTQCDAPVAAPEVCNSLDDDCNGLPDDGLGEEVCGQGVCEHVVMACVEGIPGICDPYQGASAEACNGLDDDCDGEIDEMWPDKGAACDGPDPDQCENGTLGCSDNGQELLCEYDDVNFVEVCNGLDDDCDGDTDEVEDLGETTCGLGACEHTVANCLGGQEQTCNPMEGQVEEDEPDAGFVDSNCDGMDGDASKAVFVDVASGKDLNPGTMDLPKKTIGAGLDQALADGKPYVLVSLGVYNESVGLKPGIGLFGLYDKADGWSRKLENTTQIKGGATAVMAESLADDTVVHGFFITSESATTVGGSSYGVFAKDAPGLKLVGNVIQAGSGSSGSSGSSGNPGLNGSSGSNGNQGCEYDCRDSNFECAITACLVGACGACSQPAGGAGGGSPCGSSGGKGGNGGVSGQSGQSGSSGKGPSGSVGYGGSGGLVTNNGYPGGKGESGDGGVNGGGGLDFGAIDTNGYMAAGGVNGANGTNGGGGGGGGAGGGDEYELFVDCCATYGSSGGGGGGGGCHGNGGVGGGGGGGSFGIFVSGAGIEITQTVVKTGNGGSGGSGGNGGTGGSGGQAGSGGPHGDADTQGDGAGGGVGGSGGDGGHGGGGGGGPVVGVLCSQGGSITPVEMSIQLGLPGDGGYSQGNSGLTGKQAETLGCGL